jgi:hypothetical protein
MHQFGGQIGLRATWLSVYSAPLRAGSVSRRT